MVLIAYIFVGGISGFGPNGSGHVQLETVHLPNASRDSGVAAPERSSNRLLSDDGVRMTGQESARVEQCYLCHQTDAFNDIKGLGWFKMH
jgi:hypothetical protein